MGAGISNRQPDDIYLLNEKIKSCTVLVKTILESKELYKNDGNLNYQLLCRENIDDLRQLHQRKNDYLVNVNLNRFRNDTRFLNTNKVTYSKYIEIVLSCIPREIISLIIKYIDNNYNIVLIKNIKEFYTYKLGEKKKCIKEAGLRCFVYDDTNNEWRGISNNSQEIIKFANTQLVPSYGLFLQTIPDNDSQMMKL